MVSRRGPKTLRNLAKLSHVTTNFLLLSPAVWSLSSSAIAHIARTLKYLETSTGAIQRRTQCQLSTFVESGLWSQSRCIRAIILTEGQDKVVPIHNPGIVGGGLHMGSESHAGVARGVGRCYELWYLASYLLPSQTLVERTAITIFYNIIHNYIVQAIQNLRETRSVWWKQMTPLSNTVEWFCEQRQAPKVSVRMPAVLD